jgi:hypothetical protein
MLSASWAKVVVMDDPLLTTIDRDEGAKGEEAGTVETILDSKLSPMRIRIKIKG